MPGYLTVARMRRAVTIPSEHSRLSRTQSVPSRSPLRPERSEKRTLGIRALFTIRVPRSDTRSGTGSLENFPHLACTLCRSRVCDLHARHWCIVCMRGGGNSRRNPSPIWYHWFHAGPDQRAHTEIMLYFHQHLSKT